MPGGGLLGCGSCSTVAVAESKQGEELRDQDPSLACLLLTSHAATSVLTSEPRQPTLQGKH